MPKQEDEEGISHNLICDLLWRSGSTHTTLKQIIDAKEDYIKVKVSSKAVSD